MFNVPMPPPPAPASLRPSVMPRFDLSPENVLSLLVPQGAPVSASGAAVVPVSPLRPEFLAPVMTGRGKMVMEKVDSPEIDP